MYSCVTNFSPVFVLNILLPVTLIIKNWTWTREKNSMGRLIISKQRTLSCSSAISTTRTLHYPSKFQFSSLLSSIEVKPKQSIAAFLNDTFYCRGAISTSSGFIGSSLIINNATGHSSMSSPNECMFNHVTTYLRNGTLPTNGTICQPRILPFNLLPTRP